MSSDPTPAPDKPESSSETRGSNPADFRRPRKITPARPEEETPGMSGDQLRALGEQLQALFSIAGAKSAPAASEPAPGEPIVNAKNRRFSAKGTVPAPEAAAAPGVNEGDAAKTDASVPVSAKTKLPTVSDKPVEEAFAEMRRIKLLRDARRHRRNLLLGALALMALAFIGGRLSAPSAANPAAKEPNAAVSSPRAAGLPPWTDSAVSRLNEILALDQAGKVEDAQRAATELRAAAGALPGLELYLGNLTARCLHYNDAHAELGGLSGVDIPPLINALGCDQIGFTYSRQRAFVRAIKFFADAAASDPFQAKYYLHWGEALRRRGRQGEAAGIFEQGLLRVPTNAESGGLRGVLGLKLHLAKLEAGQGGQSKEQIAAGVQDPGQAGYWQLTAAAQALQEGRFAEGAEALQKARGLLSTDEYDTLAADYFFRAFTGQNEVAAVLPSMDIPHQAARAKRGDYFVDP